MNHYRTMLLVIRAHIFQLEAFGQVVVYLNCSQLPATTDSIFHHKVQFRTIECSLTIFHFRSQAFFFASFNNSLFCFFPILIATDILFAVHLVTKRNLSFHILKIHRLEHNVNDIHHAKEFFLHLVGTTEQVSIILCKTAHTGQSVQFTTLFVAAYGSEFRDTQRQVLIRTWRILINHTVMRTIHRFQEIFFPFFGCMNRLERVLTILGVVSGSDIQVLVANRRTHYFLIIITGLDTAQEILQTDTQGSTFRQPHGKSLAHHIGKHEQIHFLTYLTMVAFLGFFQHYQIFVQHFLLRESYTINTCHLLTVFLPSPISTGHRKQLDSFDRSSRGQVGTTAKVGKRTLCISGDVSILQFGNQFTFISFTSFTEFLQRILFSDALTHQYLFLCSQLGHLGLDSG